jgi:hypothetical protein
MSYKKLVSLFAVSTLALAACGTTDDAEQPATDDTEQTEDVEQTEDADQTEDTADEGSEDDVASSDDLLQQAQEESGDAMPVYGLAVGEAGAWTQDGYVVQHAPGEAATIPVVITPTEEAGDFNVYLTEDGVITDVVSNETELEFTVESPSADVEYVVGVSPDDLGEVGDEVAAEDFYRADVVLFEEAEPAAEEE